VTIKKRGDGIVKSVSVTIKGKKYKLKKTEWSYDSSQKTIVFKGDNVKGTWKM